MSTSQEKSKRKTETKKPARARKETQRKPAESKIIAPPRKEARRKPARSKIIAPRAEEPLPEVGPEELEQFLPEKVVAAKIGDNQSSGDTPEELFIRLGSQPAEQRPAVVCLDAREEADLKRVLPWLEKFDAVVSEQYEDETRTLYEPHRVVVLNKETPEPSADWKSRPDLDWIRTEDVASDVLVLYRLYLRNDLYDFVNDDLEGFFPESPSGKTQRLADLLPASKRAAWKARVNEFKEREDEV